MTSKGRPRVQLSDVNCADLDDEIRLGIGPMQRTFEDPERGFPYFAVTAWPDPSMSFNPTFSEAHVCGRHLSALLAARAQLGDQLDLEALDSAVDRHERGLRFAFSGELALPMNRATRDARRPTTFAAHNVREGLNGLVALARHRNSKWALATAAANVAAIERSWNPATGWSLDQRGSGMPADHLVSGLGRAIGPLVRLYQLTGQQRALILAERIRDGLLLAGAFPEDGSFEKAALGTHSHSITSTLSGLALLVEATHDLRLLALVIAFYNLGLWRIRDELGWAIESLEDAADGDCGEGNTSGDMVETALALARAGAPGMLDDAERIVRAHILPSQLRDVSFIPVGVMLPDGSPLDVAQRIRGAFGFPAPYGHRPTGTPTVAFNADIVGGVTGSLCAARAAASNWDGTSHSIDLLVGHDTEALSLEAPAPLERFSVRLKRPGKLVVRKPGWSQALATIDHRVPSTRGEAGELILPAAPVDTWIDVATNPKQVSIGLRHRDHTIDARLLGPDVIAMAADGAQLTYFQPP